MRKLLSLVLIAAGGYLLFLGAREYIESKRGQSEIAHRIEQRRADAPPAAESPAIAPPVLEPGDPVGRLVIPRLNAQMYVVQGTGRKELRRGPGRLEGSAYPGTRGNCVIAGHRDTHFRVLKDIRKGDEIVLDTPQGEFLYRVIHLDIVSPRDTSSLRPTRKPVLNLITCYPFYYVGSAPKRFVVHAELAGAILPGKSPS
jgi:sortase A